MDEPAIIPWVRNSCAIGARECLRGLGRCECRSFFIIWGYVVVGPDLLVVVV